MTARLIKLLTSPITQVDLTQGSPEWFAMRRTKRTASETPVVMSLSPWTKPEQLAQRKYGHIAESSGDNKFTRHGHDNEAAARSFYESLSDTTFTPLVVVRSEFLASLDGWSTDRRVVLEIKCPFTRKTGDTWKSCLNGVVPEHYLAQCQHQLMVTSAQCCHFIAYDPADSEFLRIKVYPDHAYFDRILTAWLAFEKQYKTKKSRKLAA